jgi:hypothetical protein
MKMLENDLILNACVKTTEMFICEKILTTFATSGNKIYFKNYTLTVTHFWLLHKHFPVKL